MQGNTAAGTHGLEGLRESLRQTLEERKRNDDKIAALTKSLEDQIVELQQAKESVRTMMASVPPTTRAISNQHVAPPHPTVSDSVNIPVGKFPDVFWRWIVPTILLLAAIYFIIVFLTSKGNEGTAHLEMPQISLMETAQACTLFNRLQDRQANRATSNPLQGTADVSTPPTPCEEECSLVGEMEESVTASENITESDQETMDSPQRPLLRRQFLRNLFQRTLSRCKA